MEGITRAQIGTFLTVAVAIAVVAAGWLRSDDGAPPASGSLRAGAGVPMPAPDGGLELSRSDQQVVIHVAGAVNAPGIYRLPSGARVAAAVAKAGGTMPGADPGGVNLAAKLSDGQQVVIPTRLPGSPGASVAEDAPVSLGSATSSDLEEIDGIGPVTAERILEYRDENGGVASIEQLDEVSGIGPATVEKLHESLVP